MSYSNGVRSRNSSFQVTIIRLSLTQLAFVLVAAIITFFQKDGDLALGLLYGGFISLAGTWVHAWRVHIGTAEAIDGLGVDSSELVKGSVLKFITVIALFAIGMAVIKLESLAIVIGFVIAQTSFLFTRGYAARRKPAQRG
ncbi:MAG: ATP synthase subunit I [Gammaproteobacteria bacterium]|nr:ATP synthase subunit I [Gammaproteobacteria bacterium]